MTTSDKQKPQETGQTPSMLASWSVLGVMILLIVFSVIMFGGSVADGPLQVSMTLATLYALSVAYRYHFRGGLISDAISGSVNGSIGTVFVIIAIGTIIGALYLSGSVAAFVYYGVAIVSPKFFYVTVFLLASRLSTLVGSAFTTAGAVGTTFVALACGFPRLTTPWSPSSVRVTQGTRISVRGSGVTLPKRLSSFGGGTRSPHQSQ